MLNVTRLLEAAAAGDPTASADLLPLVYDELRKLAAARMAAELPGQTLQATALVHEAYVRLVGGNPGQPWGSRGHFFAAAAEAMRRILVDNARRRRAAKHGGGHRRVEMGDVAAAGEGRQVDLIALDEALNRLAADHPRKAALVQLRYFAGLTVEQAAVALGISASTADNDWAYAKSWLRLAIEGQPADWPG
jgi:RNA polymerase sigma factor (TIGR02999 family)